MADEEKGCYRAAGALDNFIAEMRNKLDREGRSPAYCEAFWDNLKNAAADYARSED